MLLAQGRSWRISLARGADRVVVGVFREALPEELRELRDFRIEIPLDKWNRVIKHVRTDRKLLGGVVLDFVKETDHLAAALASDRLYSELQRVLLDASASLVEAGAVVLTVVDGRGE